MPTRKAVLIGGPQDGQEIDVVDHHHHVINVPRPMSFRWTYNEGPEPQDEFRYITYRLAYTEGRPSLDDQGRLRYQYAGPY